MRALEQALTEPIVLRVAKLLWKRGEPIPVDLETALMQLGFDVRALEDRYFRP